MALLKNQFDYNLEEILNEVEEISRVVSVHIHENGCVIFGVHELTEEYIIFIRTPGFRGDFEYRDRVRAYGAWLRAKPDLESGSYGPWESSSCGENSEED